MTDQEPTRSTHREVKFPKTTTIPEGWNTEVMTAAQSNGKVAPAGLPADGNTRPVAAVSDDELLNRRLEPFPRPNTIPAGWDLSTD